MSTHDTVCLMKQFARGHQGDVDLMHAMTSGLFVAVRARQLADRSVG